MTPSKKKFLKPKKISLDPSLKEETPIVELPSDGTKLFDEDDDVWTSTIPDFPVPSEDEEEEVESNNAWEYAIDVLFKPSPLHPERICLVKWVKLLNCGLISLLEISCIQLYLSTDSSGYK